MIKFTCKNCSQKIHVSDEAAGKKGRCPKCKQAISVPQPELITLITPSGLADPNSNPGQSMIDYKCDICSNKLSSPKSEQGNIKECSNCGSFVEVPVLQKKATPPTDDNIQLQPKLPTIQDDVKNLSPASPVQSSNKTDKKGKRLIPIFLDVFLYPLSKMGIIMLLSFTLAPLVFYPIAFLGVFGPILYLIVMVCTWAYMFWYFSLCILKSAEGETRAPDTFNEDNNTSMMDMVAQLLRTIFLVVLCLLPPLVYRIKTGVYGPVFYTILGSCIFFLPMMLLASVMFDSFAAAWNPRVVLAGMFSSFLGYVMLVLVFYIPVTLYFFISQMGRRQENLGLALTLNACSIYLIMVSSHLLGWFFYKNEEKLYWSV